MQELIAKYAAGIDMMHGATAGLDAAQLDAYPVPGTWSIRQIVLHITDTELVDVDRMRRTIAEENPLLMGFNENCFIARLHNDRRDVALACDAYRTLRRSMTELLRLLSPDDFRRTAVHSERGKLTLADLVTHAIDHVEHHLKFLRHKRQLLGV